MTAGRKKPAGRENAYAIKPTLSAKDIEQMSPWERECEVHDRLMLLSAQERAFILRHLDPADERTAREKAIEAGYKPASATKAVRTILNSPAIMTITALSLANRRERHDATADAVITELANIAFADIGDLVDEGEVIVGHDKATGEALFQTAPSRGQ